MKKVKEAGYSRARISPDSPEYKFADRLKEEMHKKGMTQEYLARQMDVSLDTVKNWCQHYTFPKELQMGRLCEIFKPCSVDYFHGTIDAPNWDLQSVADFTGLSPTAVNVLTKLDLSSLFCITKILEEMDNDNSSAYEVLWNTHEYLMLHSEENPLSTTDEGYKYILKMCRDNISEKMDKLLYEMSNRLKEEYQLEYNYLYANNEQKPELVSTKE